MPLLVAPARAARPHDVRSDPVPSPYGDGPVEGCPFCPGAEGSTPPEVWALRPGGSAPDTPGWRVRAFPNLFPVLPADEGAHEVVVSSPRHVESLGDLTAEEAAAAVDGWARRSRAVEADPRGLWPFAFVNQGAMAGASLRHTHAQIVGLPFAPPLLVERARGFAGSDVCPLCAEIAGAGERIVAREAGMVAWCPPVPPLSGAIRIAPERHAPDWHEAPGAALGPLLARLLRAVDAIAPGRAANVWVHRAPPGGMERYHWHTEIVPRMGTLAGLELGAGVLALTREPTEEATVLRGLLGSAG